MNTTYQSRYTARQQLVVLRSLERERGQGWGKALTRDEYNGIVLAALIARYGARA